MERREEQDMAKEVKRGGVKRTGEKEGREKEEVKERGWEKEMKDGIAKGGKGRKRRKRIMDKKDKGEKEEIKREKE